AVVSDQSQISFMHQSRRLQRLAGLFVGQFCRGQLPQLFIDEWQQLLRRRGISLFDRRENAGYVIHASSLPPTTALAPFTTSILAGGDVTERESFNYMT